MSASSKKSNTISKNQQSNPDKSLGVVKLELAALSHNLCAMEIITVKGAV
jgi:hypothetical protein